MGNTLISWHLKNQPVVSRSSTKAEYKALADCSCEITWLISLLKYLKVFVPTLVRILCDNISTIALASNPVQHARTKHIELDCHFVRDKIKVGQIQISYVPTKAQAADIFTKALTTYPYSVYPSLACSAKDRGRTEHVEESPCFTTLQQASKLFI
ncbi:homogeneously-staining region [Tanacetum coccineum]